MDTNSTISTEQFGTLPGIVLTVSERNIQIERERACVREKRRERVVVLKIHNTHDTIDTDNCTACAGLSATLRVVDLEEKIRRNEYIHTLSNEKGIIQPSDCFG